MSDDATNGSGPPTMPEPRDGLAWAKRLVERKAMVMHVESRTVGRAFELYDGEGKVWTPPASDRSVHAPVLKLEQGHTFLAKDASAFIEFDGREASFYLDAQHGVSALCAELSRVGASKKVNAHTGVMLIAAALRQQLRELEKLHPTSAPRTA